MGLFGRKRQEPEPDGPGMPGTSAEAGATAAEAAVPVVPLAEQLRTLAGFGFRLVDDAETAVSAERPRDQLEASPYAAVLAVEDWTSDLLVLGTLSILDEFSVYADLIRQFADWTGQRDRLGEITAAAQDEDEDEDAAFGAVTAVIDGRRIEYQPELAGDWADGLALAEMARDLAAPGRTVEPYWFSGSFVLVHLPVESAAEFAEFADPYEDRP